MYQYPSNSKRCSISYSSRNYLNQQRISTPINKCSYRFKNTCQSLPQDLITNFQQEFNKNYNNNNSKPFPTALLECSKSRQMSIDEKAVLSALSTLNLNNSSSSTTSFNNATMANLDRRASRVSNKLPPNSNEDILKNFRRFSNASGGAEISSPSYTSASSSMSEIGASNTKLADQIKLRR